MLPPEMMAVLTNLLTTFQQISNAVILQNCISVVTVTAPYETPKEILDAAYEVWTSAAGEGLLPPPPARPG